MQRRLFLVAALAAAAPFARSQPRGRKRVVLIGAFTDDIGQRLRELGFTPERDVSLERARWNGSVAELRAIVAEAVKSRPDVIVACGALPVHAVMEATRTIPVVMVYGDDPVKAKYTSSLARPGGNLTGLVWVANMSIAEKTVEIFKAALPTAKAFAVMGHAGNPGHQLLAKQAENAFAPLGLRYIDMLIDSREALEPAFSRALKQQLGGIIVIPDHMMTGMMGALDQLARANRIPVLWAAGVVPGETHLVTFGPDIEDHERRAGDYVAKILGGAKPGDLAIEQTDRMILTVNLVTAKRLNLQIPESLLARADEVVR